MSEDEIRAGRAFNAKLHEPYFDDQRAREEPAVAVTTVRDKHALCVRTSEVEPHAKRSDIQTGMAGSGICSTNSSTRHWK